MLPEAQVCAISIREPEPIEDSLLDELARSCGLSLHATRERALGQARLRVASPSEDPTSILGFGLLWLLGDEAEIVDIAVAEEARRKGVGRGLVQALLDLACGAGVGRVFLETRRGNAAARRLYEACAFTEYGQRPRYYSDGEDAILYRRILQPPPSDRNSET